MISEALILLLLNLSIKTWGIVVQNNMCHAVGDNITFSPDTCSRLDGSADCTRVWKYSRYRTTPIRWACNCDSDCSIYGDCCIDYLDVCQNKSFPNTSNESRQNVKDLYVCAGVDDLSAIKAWMIGRCPPSWKDNFVRDNCEQKASLGLSIQSVPVTWPGGPDVYRNIYCAICNGRNRSEVVMWHVSVSIRGDIDSLYSYLENIQSQKHGSDQMKLLTTLVTQGHAGNFTAEQMFISMEDITGIQPRACIPYIDTCNSTLYDSVKKFEAIQRICESYYSLTKLVSGQNYEVYKNIDCLKCNDPTEIVSCDSRFFSLFKKWPFPLTLLFDINSNTFAQVTVTRMPYTQQYSQNLSCFENEVIDIVTQSCNKVTETEVNESFANVGSDVNVNKSLITNETGLPEISLRCPILRNRLTVQRGDFYVDGDVLVLSLNGITFETKVFQLIANKSLALVCFTADKISHSLQSWITVGCSSLSIICLIAYIVIYGLNKNMHNEPGKLLLNMVVSLLVAQAALLATMGLNELPSLCIYISVALHYSWLAYFTWMSVVSFDIFRTFRSVRQSLYVNRGRYVLLRYLLCGWLLPVPLVAVAVYLDRSGAGNFKVGYGLDGICWIGNRRAVLVFFLIPVAATFALSTCSFVLTLWYVIRSPTILLKIGKRAEWKQHFVTCLKAFIIMGLTWSVTLCDTLIESVELDYIANAIGSLQGAFLFCVICADKVFMKHVRKPKDSRKSKGTTKTTRVR